MHNQPLLSRLTNTRFLLQSVGTLSVVALFVSLDWSVPGLVWGMTIGQAFYGIVFYLLWLGPGDISGVLCTDSTGGQNGSNQNAAGSNSDSGGASTSLANIFLFIVLVLPIYLGFFGTVYLISCMMALGPAFALFPLTDDDNFFSTLTVAIEIYWPVAVILLIVRFRDLPWGKAYQSTEIPFLPDGILPIVIKNPIVVIVGAIIANQGWDIYGPIVLVYAAMYFYEPKFGLGKGKGVQWW